MNPKTNQENQSLKLLRCDLIGPVTAKRLLKHFGTVDAVFAASDQELLNVEKIGPCMLRSIKQNAEWYKCLVSKLF
jgi:Fanconi anemia group M protein